MANLGKLFIVSAPSGAGKTTLVKEVVRLFSDSGVDLCQAITYTTKKPRNNEKNGRDYYFIDKKEFEKKIKENFFLEYSTAYGYYYGTPRSYVDTIALGRSLILIIDRAGAQQILTKVCDAILIWLYVKDTQTLKQRLENRNGESSQEINKRLKLAVDEITCEQKTPLYKYHILNDLFITAVTEFCAIVQRELSVKNRDKVTKKIKKNSFEI